VLTDSVAAEGPFLDSQTAILLLCPHVAEGERELSGVSLIRALISLIRAPPS